jgi:hypothetical protein
VTQFLPRTTWPFVTLNLLLFALPDGNVDILSLVPAMHTLLARVQFCRVAFRVWIRAVSRVWIKFAEGGSTSWAPFCKVCEGVNLAAASTQAMCCTVEIRCDG